MIKAVNTVLALAGCICATPVSAQQLDRYETQPELNSSVMSGRNIKLDGVAIHVPEHDEKYILMDSARPFIAGSGRLSFKLASDWTLQISRKQQRTRPDQIDPADEVRRTMVSVMYEQANWHTTIAAGRSARAVGGNGSYLLESTWNLEDAHTVFGRFERASSTELFNDGDALYGSGVHANKLTLGYLYEVAASGPIKLGIGAVASKYFATADQPAWFGNTPSSCGIFMRLRLQYP